MTQNSDKPVAITTTGQFAASSHIEAFWKKVDKREDGECWNWIGARAGKGYGKFRNTSAHAFSYNLANGPVPDGLEIDHLCRNKSCVNPHHLEAVTRQENVRRAQPDFCIRGHPLSGENVKIKVRPDGTRRMCKECDRLWKRENWRRLRNGKR